VIAIPAVDLREGACVQLVGGRYEDERIRIEDPLEVARGWARAGFRRLHVVDLDRATGRGTNAEVVRAILAGAGVECQVGGGLRNEAEIAELLAAGARSVVLGTRAVEEPAWLVRMAMRFPGRVIVAADVRDRRVATRGWEHLTGIDVLDFAAVLSRLPLAGVLVTAVDREGRLDGTDLELMEDLTQRTDLPLYASGGISMMSELRSLADFGVHAAVLGLALYSGSLEPRLLVEEFAS
jgi:phosphoribosylformimino-5-aminoimidazole carboxamide ribotide isomerase